MKFETYFEALQVVIHRKMLAEFGGQIERFGRLEIKLQKKVLSKFWQVEQKMWDLETQIEELKKQHERELEAESKQAFDDGVHWREERDL